MNSLLLLILLLAFIVIYLFSLNQENFTNGVNSSSQFYPTNQNMILDNCESIKYVNCLTNTDNCDMENIQTINGCKNKQIKIYIDMIYGNEYIFLEKPYYLDDITGDTIFLEQGLILVRFNKDSSWFKVGFIDSLGFHLKKLFSNLDSNNLPLKTSINWKHNEPIVFIHRQKNERLSLNNINVDDGVIYYVVKNQDLIFVKTLNESPNTPISVKRISLNGSTTSLENLNISNLFDQADIETSELSNYTLEKTNDELEKPNILNIQNNNPQMNKINSKTLYFDGKDSFKQTYNPSDTYIDKNITLLSKLYGNNNEIKNLEQEIDKMIEKINL